MGARQALERDVLSAFTKALKRERVLFLRLALLPQVGAGWPDVLVLPGGGIATFVELKRPGGKTTKLQDFVHKLIRAAGCDVFVIDNVAEAEALVAFLTDKGE